MPPSLPGTPTDGAVDSLVLPLIDIVDGAAVYDLDHERKQPDWTFDATDSGVYPAQRLQDQPVASDAVSDQRRLRSTAH